MRNLYFSLSIILLTHCVHISTVTISESDDLIREDLAQVGGGELSDLGYEIVRFRHRDIKTEDGTRKQLRFRRASHPNAGIITETSLIRINTPVWLAHNATTIVKANDDAIANAMKLYHDPTLTWSMAAVFNEQGHLFFFGSMSDAYIAPLSNRTIGSLKKEKPHLFEEDTWDDDSEDVTVSDYHIIYTPKNLTKNERIPIDSTESLKVLKSGQGQTDESPHERSKRSTADTVYPEVLAVLDYNETYTSCREVRCLNLLIYIISFWDSVNLRFSTLQDPKVQLRLTGIVVSLKRGALQFINDSISDGMLNVVVAWFAPRFIDKYLPKSTYDILVIQTNMQLCETNRERKCMEDGILGYTIPGPGCHIGTNAITALVHDDMLYRGIHTAVHEVAHALGAAHDTSPLSTNCSDRDGYIMASEYKYHDRQFEWSPCSKKRLSQRLRSSVGNCLDNNAPTAFQGDLLNEMMLPGKFVSPEAQCLSRGYTFLCESLEICKDLRCQVRGWFCQNAGPALDGTKCPGGECQNGQCVSQ